ncbi:hypothetical protein D9758_000428 [Tetrapyrgos nigripes]|uniref:Uncharacterized protein n=1 Tax=Tetrapyrgos nigripes TaxID=182062 RepID=A0A8H5H148_9AGAR|nr:hypothetical protein D9758_000428 [Tetrapyrgos nigripes]
MTAELSPQDLLRNKDSTRTITFGDGLAGALHRRTQEFITNPNRRVVYQPPFGSTRDLYRRSDTRYGEDDPL